MTPPSRVTWTPTRADHVARLRHLGRAGSVRRLALGTALLVGLLAAGLLQASTTTAQWVMAAIVLAAWSLTAAQLLLRSRLAVWHLDRVHPVRVSREPHTLSLHPWGASLEVAGARRAMSWGLLAAPRLARGQVILPTAGGRDLVVPRAAWTSDEALEAFLEEGRSLAGTRSGPVAEDPVLRGDERWTTHGLRFSLGRSDYIALYRDSLARRVRSRWLLAVAGVVLGLTTPALLILPDTVPLAVLVLVVSALLVLRGTQRWWRSWLLPWQVGARLDAHPELYPTHEQLLHLGPAGISGHLGPLSLRCPWSHVLDVGSTRDHVLVYISHSEAFILPRAALADSYDLQARMETWVEAIPRAGEPPVVKRAPAPAPDPFAPPES